MSDTLLTHLAKPNASLSAKAFALIKAYFIAADEDHKTSNKRKIAWFYLLGILLCVLALIGLSLALTWWSAGFWAILAAKAVSPFFISLAEFAVMLVGMVFFNVLKNHLIGKLSIRWREWLTNKLLEVYFNGDNYLKLARLFPKLKHLDQRIQEDVQKFVSLTLTIGSDVLKSILSLGAFAGTLWVLGGSLAIGLNIIVPGYMLWVALIVAGMSTFITHFLARSLAKKNAKLETSEANFRRALGEVTTKAENIALEQAGPYHEKELAKHYHAIHESAEKRLNTQSKLIGFQNLYQQLTMIVPYLLAAPALFAGTLGLEALMAISGAFMEVSASFSCFISLYENISSWLTSVSRIVEYTEALNKSVFHANAADIQVEALKAKHRKRKNKDCINILGLSLVAPFGETKMMHRLNLQLKPGEHTCIGGRSGLGKSTLFKALAGTWKFGEGKIFLPHGKTMCFLPQNPSFIHANLKTLLAFPDSPSHYTLKQCQDALRAVGMEKYLPELWDKEEKNWDNFSGGEKQRIAFARALLKKPDWLFLDEATSAMDIEGEAKLYRAIKKHSPNTTIVSIAHRETVPKFHDRKIYLSDGPDGKTIIQEGFCHKPALKKEQRESRPQKATVLQQVSTKAEGKKPFSASGFFAPQASLQRNWSLSVLRGSQSESSDSLEPDALDYRV